MNSRPTRSSKRSPSARRAILTWIAGIVALTAGPAIAVDGVIEINQDKVAAAGGFPFIISVPGSYRLTSNLTSPTTAIGVAVSEVTIDLNGFSLVGSDSGTGIQADFRDKIAVHNGSVSGFFKGIVATGKGADIQHVRLFANRDSGITCGAECRVSSSTIDGGAHGVIAGNGSRILDNAVDVGGAGSVGIDCASRCIVSSNTVNGGARGITALEGEIIGNSVRQEDASNFTSKGLEIGDALVKDNHVFGHYTSMVCTGSVGYSGNVLQSPGSPVSGSCTDLGHNLCIGFFGRTCP
jgi:hypothetical protein